MAYTALTSGQIAAGEPVAQELFSTIKTNEADFDTRLDALEATNTLGHPIDFSFSGVPSSLDIADGKAYWRVPFNFTATACRLVVITAGTAGTLTVDVEYKRGAGAWTSINTAVISAGFASGDLFTVNATLAVTSFVTADLIRVNLDAIQTNMNSFFVVLER